MGILVTVEFSGVQVPFALSEHAVDTPVQEDAETVVLQFPAGGQVVLGRGIGLCGNGRRAQKERRRALTRDVAAYAARRADAIVWLVYDGAGASGEASGNFRVSYSGGEGAHRADRLITDYLRAALLAGAALPAEVATSDRDLAAAAAKLGAAVRGAKEFIAEMEMEA